MTLVEAARRLTERGFTPYDEDDAIICELCDQPVAVANTPNGWAGHAPVCPWLSMPRIVAALEAADRLIDRGGTGDVNEWIALARALDDERVLA